MTTIVGLIMYGIIAIPIVYLGAWIAGFVWHRVLRRGSRRKN